MAIIVRPINCQTVLGLSSFQLKTVHVPLVCVYLIGVSMGEPCTSVFNCNFSYIIYYLLYVVPSILDAVI